jgi:hypothetical protein
VTSPAAAATDNSKNDPLLSNVTKLHTAASLNSREDECHSATQKIPHFVWKLTVFKTVHH